jgi:hypothetical protein
MSISNCSGRSQTPLQLSVEGPLEYEADVTKQAKEAYFMKNTVFSDVALCGFCKNRRFGGT